MILLIKDNMYKLSFLPIAKQDIDNIIYYISNVLNNRIAARNLSNNFIKGANSILDFPYGLPAYESSKKLEYEYRCLRIKNFLMFYTINENNKTITIVRVIYKGRNIDNILDN